MIESKICTITRFYLYLKDFPYLCRRILKTSFYFYYDKTIENRGACQAGARY